ncbi:PREDICTED: cytochrome b-c1 complex subunit 7-2-like [Nelumbo nucifera]|uniref:Complex III subunit VII n=1 Tax=Nelumbo nucifera TaxID=4432 RepID=A0A1U7ZU63_NELNU|nr:PREDICTED: cytochrome b-c1 complex subunit 7-2-like [Nelumbo nucifera]
MALSMLPSLNPSKNSFTAQHMKSLSKCFKKYGLRYDDLYDPMYDLDIRKAMARLPCETVDATNQRLKDAVDLLVKHKYLPDDLQAMKTSFRKYLQDVGSCKEGKGIRKTLGADVVRSSCSHVSDDSDVDLDACLVSDRVALGRAKDGQAVVLQER